MLLQEPGRRNTDGDLAAIRLWLRRRARRNVTRALQIETLRLAGLSHEQSRLQLGLSVEQYRRARRWLRDAVAQSVASRDLLPVAEALERHSERHVEQVLRLGVLKRAGHGRREIQARLGLTDDEFEACDAWWRDAVTLTRAQEV